MLHPVTNALGLCLTEFTIQLEPVSVNELISETIVQTIGNESSIIVDLALIAMVSYETPDLECGDVAYIIADATQESFITVDPIGLVTLQTVSDTSLIGVHTVQIMAFLKEGDPEATVKKLVPLTLTIRIEDATTTVDSEFVEAINESLTKGPPVSTSMIAPLYKVYFERSTQYFSFSFADRLALNGEADEDKLGGLDIRVTNNSIAGIVEIS